MQTIQGKGFQKSYPDDCYPGMTIYRYGSTVAQPCKQMDKFVCQLIHLSHLHPHSLQIAMENALQAAMKIVNEIMIDLVT
jgi:hypothetical protein